MSRETGVNGCGYVVDFVRHRSRSMEHFWKSEVEDDLGGALQAVAAGTALSSPTHRSLLIKAVAMHMTRSRAFAEIQRRVSRDVIEKVGVVMHGDPEFLDRAFYVRHGFFAAGPEGRELMRSELLAPTERLVRTGEYLRARLPDLFKITVDVLASSGLTLSRVPAGNVAIGDNPVLALDRTRDGYVIGAAVPANLVNPGVFLFPLGPEWIAALDTRDPQDRHEEAKPEYVRFFNHFQMLTAENHVVVRCGTWSGGTDTGAS